MQTKDKKAAPPVVADLSVEPFPGKEAVFCNSFGDDYYLSTPAVHQAVRLRSSFNIIHTPTGFKVDVFVRKDRPFEESVMHRRQCRECVHRSRLGWRWRVRPARNCQAYAPDCLSTQ